MSSHIHYVTRLKEETNALRAIVANDRKKFDDALTAFSAFLHSEKFSGVASDGSRKDWIATSDVQNWIRDTRASLLE
jgi:hypothetical protein